MEYQDLHIDNVTHQGCTGIFVMSDSLGRPVQVPFTYHGRQKHLELSVDADTYAAFITHFRAEAHEAWMDARDDLRGKN